MCSNTDISLNASQVWFQMANELSRSQPEVAPQIQERACVSLKGNLSSHVQPCHHNRYSVVGIAYTHIQASMLVHLCQLQAPAAELTAAAALQQAAEVVQLYRYPGLSSSAAQALSKKVHLDISVTSHASALSLLDAVFGAGTADN